MSAFELIRSIQRASDGRSLAGLLKHAQDEVCDCRAFTRSLALTLGQDVAGRFGRILFKSFAFGGSCDANVDIRAVVTAYRAVVLCPNAFYQPKQVLLSLLQDYTEDGETWKLDDVEKVVSVAATSEEDAQVAKRLRKGILVLSPPSSPYTITPNVLERALNEDVSIIAGFRSQLISRLTDEERLQILAEEEVSKQRPQADYFQVPPPSLISPTYFKRNRAKPWLLSSTSPTRLSRTSAGECCV